MKHRYQTTSYLILLASAFFASVFCLIFYTQQANADDYPQAKILLESTETIAGEPLRYPQSAPAKITTAIITIPPGSSTGWHAHSVPIVGYIISGELEMEYANGKRVTLKQGDSIVEAMGVAHIGANTGKIPASLFVTFIGEENASFTHLTAAPGLPPTKHRATAEVNLVDLSVMDKRLKFDIRYAGSNNFMGKALYPKARALLQKPAAEALIRAHERLRKQGYGLLVFDAYRPWSVTREMWDKHPHYREYLADPLKGSRHNRGCAIDLTLFDLRTGQPVPMPSDYDEFTERAHPDYQGGSAAARESRDMLRAAMEAEGFKVYENEWWHFDFEGWGDVQGWEHYPIMNTPL